MAQRALRAVSPPRRPRSLAATDAAAAPGLDVHVSLDKVVVMFHDPDLSRTTGSQGE